MKTILKYTITPGRSFRVTSEFKVFIPLTIQLQGNMPQLWVLVGEPSPDVLMERVFFVLHTGEKIYDPEFEELGPYVGTFQLDGGQEVFHVFEAIKWTPNT